MYSPSISNKINLFISQLWRKVFEYIDELTQFLISVSIAYPLVCVKYLISFHLLLISNKSLNMNCSYFIVVCFYHQNYMLTAFTHSHVTYSWWLIIVSLPNLTHYVDIVPIFSIVMELLGQHEYENNYFIQFISSFWYTGSDDVIKYVRCSIYT